MKQSTCGAVFCQPSGDELKHNIHIIVILLIVFCHDLLKTNLCYIVLILGLLIFTVAAAAAVLL